MFFSFDYQTPYGSDGIGFPIEEEYVSYQTFGNQLNVEEFINILFEHYKPSKDYIGNLIYLREFYYSYFNIHDFRVQSQPLDIVALHPKEVFNRNHLFDNRLRRYIQLGVKEVTGFTFDEYMKRPRYEIEAIDRLIEEKHEFERKIKREEEIKELEKRDSPQAKKENYSLEKAFKDFKK